MTDAPDLVNSIVTVFTLRQDARMRSFIKICVFGMAVSGCGPLSIYYKPGVAVSRMQTDTLNCEVKALNDAPVANQIRQRPPVYYPGRQYCSGGNCTYRAGYWVSGGFYTVDVNASLRSRVEDQCMAQIGYQPVRLPRCSAGVAAQVPTAATRTLPQLTENSCSIINDDGTWQIVTPVVPIASE